MSASKLSIVVPVYRKSAVIEKFFLGVSTLLQEMNLEHEIIAVVDGSPDNSAELITELNIANLKLIVLPQNFGKAHAVRHGMGQANGDYIGFLDCGLDIELTVLTKAVKEIPNNYDAIIANKFLNNSVRKFSLFRLAISRFFTVLRATLFSIKFTDTQTGFKLFRKDIVDIILPQLQEKRWLVDIEMLSLMDKHSYSNVKEIPVEINAYNPEEVSDSIRPKALLANIIDLIVLSSRVGRISSLKKKLNPKHTVAKHDKHEV